MPDDSTLVVFRKRLGPAKFKELFDEVVAKAGATQLPQGRLGPRGRHQGDRPRRRRNTISLLREGRRRLLSALAKIQPTKAGELEDFAEPLLENDFPNQDKLLGAEAVKTMVLLQETAKSRNLRNCTQVNQVLDGDLGSFADPDARDGFQKADDPFFGYKVVATCNEKGIVQAAAVLPGNESEMGQVQGQIEQLEENGVRAKRLAADKGYDSNDNRDLVAEHHLKPYIPVKKTSRDKTGFPFQYDKVHDCLVCKAGNGPSARPRASTGTSSRSAPTTAESAPWRPTV